MNAAFLKAWGDKFGDTSLIHEIAVSHYQGLLLWAQAVKNAGSAERMKVIEAIEGGLSIDGPAGKVSVDPKTHHAIPGCPSDGVRKPDHEGARELLAASAGRHAGGLRPGRQSDDNQQYEIKISIETARGFRPSPQNPARGTG